MKDNLLFKFDRMVKEISKMDISARKQLGCEKTEIIFNTYLNNFGPEQGTQYAFLVFMYATQVVCNGKTKYINNFSEICDYFEWNTDLKEMAQELKSEYVKASSVTGLSDLKTLVHAIHNDNFNMDVYTYMVLVANVGGIDEEAIARVKDLFHALLLMA